MVEEKGEEINFRKWITKVIMLMIVLSGITYAVEFYFAVDLFLDLMITVIAVLIVFFLHEYLHYYTALRFGYNPEWYRTRFMMGFDIDTNDRTQKAVDLEIGLSSKQKKQKHLEESKKIALAPYYICIPVSIVLIIWWLLFGINGLLYAGILGIIGHLIALPMEAKILK